MTPQPDDLAARIERLEEALLFSERTIEQLSEEVRSLGERTMASDRALRETRELASRLSGRIDELIAAKDAPGDDATQALKDDRPPHSSGRVQGY